MMNFNCLYCQSKIDAYLDSELSPKARRRVVQHLDRCITCYTLYVQRRDLKRELQRALPLIGQRDAPDFKQMWGTIRSELPHPEAHQRHFLHARYGFVVLAMMLMLVLPLTMAHRDIPLILPSQPAAQSVLMRETPDVTEPFAMATAVASLTVESEYTPATSLPIVAEPPTQDFARGMNGRNN
jgi:hypothetical protein